MPDHPHVYIADAPVSEPEHDRFRRWPFAQRIAQTIVRQRDPSSMVIAIYGAWGTGKTTVLNFIHKALADEANVTPLKYNPWRYATEDQMLAGFLQFLADALKRTLKTKVEVVAQAIARYGKCLAPVLPGAEVGAHAVGELAGVALDDLKDRVGEALLEEGKKLVVLIDDVDRLDKAEIHALFRLIKLTADFSNVVYVLAFDHDIVAASLGERYGSGDCAAGASFLEKIIQVPLHLPDVNAEALRKYAFSCLNEAVKVSGLELSEGQVQEFGLDYSSGIEPRLMTPRICKRYANAVSFALGILPGEVNPVDLMLVEALRTLYAGMYGVIRCSKEAVFAHAGFNGSDHDKALEAFQATIDASLEGQSEHVKEGAHAIVRRLLPQVAHLFGGRSVNEEGFQGRWYTEKRLASRSYFDRYFSYAIPEGDIPDQEVDNLIGALATTVTTTALATRLTKMANDYGAEPLVSKLRAAEKELSPDASKVLAQAVVRVAADFPRPDSFFGFETPFAQAAILVGNLLKNMPEEGRLVQAEELLEGATSLAFALQLLIWLKPLEGESDYDEGVRKGFDDALGGVLAERIEAESATCDFLSEYASDLQSILWIWADFGDADAARSYVDNLLEADDKAITQFLLSYTPTSWSESGKSRRGGFDRDQYDRVTSIVDGDSIIQRLRKTYGDALEDPRDRFGEFEDDGEWVAHQFCRIHLAVTKPETDTPEPCEGD